MGQFILVSSPGQIFRIMMYLKAFALSSLICGAIAQSRYRPGAGGPDGGSGSDNFNSPGFGGSGGSSSGGNGDGAGGSDGASGSLEEAIPGVPGDDYPIFAEVPETSFLCDGQADGGYYADPEAECQAFHICANDGSAGLTKYSFLCPNGTLFQQQYFVCDWWFNVDCSTAEEFYSLNDEIAAERAANSPEGSDGAGQYQGGAGGAGGKQGGGARRGGSGASSGRRGGSSGSQAAASSPRGSYSSPDASGAGPSYTSPAEFGGNGFGSADAGYGAPGGSDGGFGGAGAGYGAPALGGYSRRNARGLPVDEISEFELASDIEEDIEY